METIRSYQPDQRKVTPRCASCTHLIPVAAVLDNLVGDGTGLGKRGHVLADRVERDFDGLWQGSGQLGLWLVANDGHVAWGASDSLFDRSGDTRVDTTAQTTVGGDGEVEDLGVGLGLGERVLEEL